MQTKNMQLLPLLSPFANSVNALKVCKQAFSFNEIQVWKQANKCHKHAKKQTNNSKDKNTKQTNKQTAASISDKTSTTSMLEKGKKYTKWEQKTGRSKNIGTDSQSYKPFKSL